MSGDSRGSGPGRAHTSILEHGASLAVMLVLPAVVAAAVAMVTWKAAAGLQALRPLGVRGIKGLGSASFHTRNRGTMRGAARDSGLWPGTRDVTGGGGRAH